MTAANLRLPPDSSGQRIAAQTIVDESTNTVLRVEQVIADPVVVANRLQVFAEDAAHATGDKGLLALLVRRDAETSPVSTDGDYSAALVDVGRTKVNSRPMTPARYSLNSAGTTNLTSAVVGAATLYNIVASNINAAIRYLKIYDKGSAPVLASDVPLLTIAIPLTGSRDIDLGALGMRFTNGIALATTTGATDTDTGVVAANEIKVVLNYAA